METASPNKVVMPKKFDIRITNQYSKFIMKNYEFHDCYEFFFLQSTSDVEYFIEGKNIPIRPGNLVIVPPRVVHKIKWNQATPHKRILIFVYESYVREYLANKPDLFQSIQTNVLQFGKQKRAWVEDLMMRLWEEVNVEVPDQTMIKALLIQFLVTVERISKTNHATILSGSVITDGLTYISQIAQYINEHYSEDISLSVLAKKFHVSQSYISRIFKEEIGSNYSDYLRIIRLHGACNLLLDTNLKVQTIAEKVGFKSSNHFCKTFKAILQMTPLDYRKAN